MDTETPIEQGLALLKKPARIAVLVVLCTIDIAVGSYEAWAMVSEQRANAMEIRVAPVEKRVSDLETANAKVKDDVSQIKSDVAVVRQILEDRLPAKH